jgi:hypothetical protein
VQVRVHELELHSGIFVSVPSHECLNFTQPLRVVKDLLFLVGGKQRECLLGKRGHKAPAFEQMLLNHVFTVDEPNAESCKTQRDQGHDSKVPEDLEPESSETPDAHGGVPFPSKDCSVRMKIFRLEPEESLGFQSILPCPERERGERKEEKSDT